MRNTDGFGREQYSDKEVTDGVDLQSQQRHVQKPCEGLGRGLSGTGGKSRNMTLVKPDFFSDGFCLLLKLVEVIFW